MYRIATETAEVQVDSSLKQGWSGLEKKKAT